MIFQFQMWMRKTRETRQKMCVRKLKKTNHTNWCRHKWLGRSHWKFCLCVCVCVRLIEIVYSAFLVTLFNSYWLEFYTIFHQSHILCTSVWPLCHRIERKANTHTHTHIYIHYGFFVDQTIIKLNERRKTVLRFSFMNYYCFPVFDLYSLRFPISC